MYIWLTLCDLNLDPMTLTYELRTYMYILQMHLHTKNDISRSRH